MDCQNFKELLDSYLCGELAVETNHSILRHVERCGACRAEMAARRRLRASLRIVCSKEKMSDRAMESLRERIRSEAGIGSGAAPAGDSKGGNGWFAGLFKIWLLTPAAIAILLCAALGLYVLRSGGSTEKHDGARTVGSLSLEQIKALELSASLVTESAECHRICAAYFDGDGGPPEMPDSVKEYDPACMNLDKIAAEGAGGLSLRTAHVCKFGERRFAHLIYARGAGMVSLIVTARDTRALKSGEAPPFSGLSLGLQRFTFDHVALGAYQTLKRIILVASDFPEDENASIAEILAKPVVEHFRKAEAGAGLEERVAKLRIADRGSRQRLATMEGEK